MTSDDTWQDVSQFLIGVLDLRCGVAVHAIAGQRTTYQPVPHHDAASLIDHYRSFGIRQFYLADLDALTGGLRQWSTLQRLARQLTVDELVWIDAGWRDREPKEQWESLEQLMAIESRLGQIRWVVATESAGDPDGLDRLRRFHAAERLTLGLDVRDGQFVGEGTIETWLSHADEVGIHEAIVLDVAAVGTNQGPRTMALCQTIGSQVPHWRLISGGGVRSTSDVDAILDAGCDGCLIASALL